MCLKKKSYFLFLIIENQFLFSNYIYIYIYIYFGERKIAFENGYQTRPKYIQNTEIKNMNKKSIPLSFITFGLFFRNEIIN